jgi:hypothetical protein
MELTAKGEKRVFPPSLTLHMCMVCILKGFFMKDPNIERGEETRQKCSSQPMHDRGDGSGRRWCILKLRNCTVNVPAGASNLCAAFLFVIGH